MTDKIECWCEHVDIGVGNQKVYEHPECPQCADPTTLPVSKIVFGGDTHGDVNQVYWLIEKAQAENAQVVFVLGDFGVWSHLDGGAFVEHVSKRAIKTGIRVCFLPGNHENYDLLEIYEQTRLRTRDGFVLISPGILYSPRGHRWEWAGTRFLSLGGAYSIDKQPRVLSDWADVRRAKARQERGYGLSARDLYAIKHDNLSWWPQEEITQKERDRAMEGGEVDVMLTHDKPLRSNPSWNRKSIDACLPNQQKIQDVMDAVCPQLLLHGHLHYAYDDVITYDGCETFVKGLDCDPEGSAHSGGSGNRNLSYAVLDLRVDRPSTPEPGADENCFSLKWFDEDKDQWGRDFLRRARETA